VKHLLTIACVLSVIVAILWGGQPDEVFEEPPSGQQSHTHQEGVGAHDHDEKVGIITSRFQSEPAVPDGADETPTGWSGECRLPDGLPACDCRVEFVAPLADQGDHFRPGWRAVGRTDDEGRFEVILEDQRTEGELPAQVTMVCNAQPESDDIVYHTERVAVVRGEVTELGTLVLGSVGTTITGSVRRVNGAPVSGVRVRALFPTGSVAGPTAVTNADGLYRMAGLRCWGDTVPNHLRVTLESPEISFANGSNQPSPAFPEEAGKLVRFKPTQHLVPTAGGVADFEIELADPPLQVDFVTLENVGDTREGVGFLVLDGKRRLVQGVPIPVNLVAGQVARMPLGLSLERAMNDTHTVELYQYGGTHLFRAKLQLLRGGPDAAAHRLHATVDRWVEGTRFKGHVLDARGQPLANATVGLTPTEETPFQALPYRRTETNEKGEFILDPVAPGMSYRLSVRVGARFEPGITHRAKHPGEQELGTVHVNHGQ